MGLFIAPLNKASSVPDPDENILNANSLESNTLYRRYAGRAGRVIANCEHWFT